MHLIPHIFQLSLVSRLRLSRSAIPALALGTNISTVTAWANDYDYETGLARELEAIGCQKIYYLCFRQVEKVKI